MTVNVNISAHIYILLHLEIPEKWGCDEFLKNRMQHFLINSVNSLIVTTTILHNASVFTWILHKFSPKTSVDNQQTKDYVWIHKKGKHSTGSKSFKLKILELKLSSFIQTIKNPPVPHRTVPTSKGKEK